MVLFIATSLLLLAAPTQEAGAAAKKRRVIRVEETRVEGRIHKPQAFYILQRSQVAMDDLARSERFAPRILGELSRDVF